MTALHRIAFIGNSLPRRCGIATFTTDLQQAVAASAPDLATSIVAMNEAPQTTMARKALACHGTCTRPSLRRKLSPSCRPRLPRNASTVHDTHSHAGRALGAPCRRCCGRSRMKALLFGCGARPCGRSRCRSPGSRGS